MNPLPLLVCRCSLSKPACARDKVAAQIAATGHPARWTSPIRWVISSISPPSHASPPGRMRMSPDSGRMSFKRSSGITLIPPMLTMGLVARENVPTENPNLRRNSASADAGSQSANPSKTKTYAVRVAIDDELILGDWFGDRCYAILPTFRTISVERQRRARLSLQLLRLRWPQRCTCAARLRLSHYSDRSAVSGSMLAARRAGIMLAPSATSAMPSTANTNVIASFGFTP
jgi:hypothetical protein